MKFFLKLSGIVLTLVFFIQLFAGPTIIRDNRIRDTAMTPVLGRGYTISTNTLQSLCMLDVQITEPSYDFQYKFEEIETSKTDTVKTRTHVDAEVQHAMATVTVDTTATTDSATTETSHHIQVEINMDSYYASVDEAKTKLSDSAASLLQNNDIPGFFSSCGSYYIRSIGRNAKYLSIFSYKTKTTKRDVGFEAKLKVALKSFGPVQGGHVNAEQSTNIGSEASSKQLTITSMAWGLGKNEGASLVSFDLETFKAAIKDAFISMQSPVTGKVRTMEVVPWVENTEFQNLIKLEEEIIDKETGKKMLLYKKKHILNLNGEYLAEIERADRNLMNIYYKAKICRQTIDAHYKLNERFRDGFAEAKLMNLRTGDVDMTLTELDKLLTDEKIDEYLKKEEKFMYDGSKGAQICIRKMLESGMFVLSWRDIPECKKLRGDLSEQIDARMDDHCMPILAPDELQGTTPTPAR
ncbi:MAG: hypothetical protein GY754_33285 [bacterium]|nr:hypothetical protein [bacterium]